MNPLLRYIHTLLRLAPALSQLRRFEAIHAGAAAKGQDSLASRLLPLQTLDAVQSVGDLSVKSLNDCTCNRLQELGGLPQMPGAQPPWQSLRRLKGGPRPCS